MNNPLDRKNLDLEFKLYQAGGYLQEHKEEIVRTVGSHDGLLFRLIDMSRKYHERCGHQNYFHNCDDLWCADNRKTIEQAAGK